MTSDLSVKQTCDQLNLSQSSVYRLIKQGKLIAYHAGRSVRIPYSSIQELRASNQIKTRTNRA